MPYKDPADHAAYNAKWQKDNRDKRRVIERRYVKNNPEKVKKWHQYNKKAWRNRNIEHSRMLTRGSVAVSTAVKNGTLTRPATCSKCLQEGRIEAHHHNGYDKEHILDVIWLCRSCHRSLHRPNESKS